MAAQLRACFLLALLALSIGQDTCPPTNYRATLAQDTAIKTNTAQIKRLADTLTAIVSQLASLEQNINNQTEAYEDLQASVHALSAKVDILTSSSSSVSLSASASPSISPSAPPSPSPNAYQLAAFGDNTYGQLGDGTTNMAATPTAAPLPSSGRAKLFSGGFDHVIATYDSWNIAVWGRCYAGDGTPQQNTVTQATAVPTLSGTVIKDMCAGLSYDVVVTSSGDVYVWGANSNGALAQGPAGSTQVLTASLVDKSIQFGGFAIDKVACGSAHVMFYSASARAVWVSGYGGQGQIGVGTTTATNPNAQQPNFNGQLVGGSEYVVDIAVGHAHNFAVTNLGRLFGWGDNTYGQVGDGSTALFITTPTLVSFAGDITASTFVSFVAAGSAHSIALDSNNEIYVWGLNTKGQLCDADLNFNNSSLPHHVAKTNDLIPQNITKVVATSSTTMLLTNSGQLYGCGLTVHLGIVSANQFTPVPTQITSTMWGSRSGLSVRDISGKDASSFVGFS